MQQPIEHYGPNLFVVGAAKAGTTTIHSVLASHPDIFMTPVKEPNYFATVSAHRAMKHLTRQMGSAEYAAMFAKAPPSLWRGESSCSYLYDAGAAARIKSSSPQAKIIISLRDPVARAYSHYLMDCREGVQHLSFEMALKEDRQVRDRTWGGEAHLYFDLGLYHSQVERFLRLFGDQNVLLIDFAELSDVPALTRRLKAFLQLSKPFEAPRTLGALNAYRASRSPLAHAVVASRRGRRLAQRLLPRRCRRFIREKILFRDGAPPTLPEADAQLLRAKYAEDLQHLEQVVGRRIPVPEQHT